MTHSLLSYLSQLPDSRQRQGRRHCQTMTLQIIIMSCMSGYHSYRAIGDFIQKHQQRLLDLFEPPKARLPSYSTVRRVILCLEFDPFCWVLQQWMIPQRQPFYGHGLCVDGKVIGGTVTQVHSRQQNYTNLLSVVSQEDQAVLATAEVQGNKQSEIPVVRELIAQLEMHHVVYTMDALHCQTQTIETILSQGNDYVIALKGNQKNLYAQAKLNTQGIPLDCYWKQEKNRGRLETRVVEIYDNLEGVHYRWKGMNTLIKVQRTRFDAHKLSDETVFYISSLSPDIGAEAFAQGIRGHWRIENGCHFIKDTLFQEDDSPILAQNSPKNMSLIRSIILNLVRKQGRLDITKALREWAHEIPLLDRIIRE